MVSKIRLQQLREQKDLLVTECDLHRGILHLEITRIRHSFDWVSRGGEWLHKVRPWIPLAAPVAGFFMARNWRTVLKWSGRAVSWRLLNRFFH